MKNNFKRVILNAAIILLFLNAIFLTALCWFSSTNGSIRESAASVKTYLSGIFKRTNQNTEIFDYTEYAYSADILAPLRGAVRTEAGLACVTDRDGARALFENVGSIMTSAFDTAVMDRELSSREWLEYLGGEMILFDFQGSVPLYSVAAYLGTGRFETLYLEPRYLMLVPDDEGMLMCVKTEDGRMYAYKTSAYADISSLTEVYPPDGSQLGADSAFAKNLPAECMLTKENRLGTVLNENTVITDFASTGVERMVNGILESLGFNTYSTGGYIESDSTHVYVEALNTLRIHPDGNLNYIAGNEEKTAGTLTYEDKAAMVSRAVEIVRQVMSEKTGAADLYIRKTYTENGSFVVLFGCECSGMMLECDNGYCARFVFRGLKLMEAQIRLVEYNESEENEILIPDVQAAALAAENGKTDNFELRYSRRGDEWHCGWFCD